MDLDIYIFLSLTSFSSLSAPDQKSRPGLRTRRMNTEPQLDPHYALVAAPYALPPSPARRSLVLVSGSAGGGTLPFHPAALYRLPQTDGPAGSEDDDEDEYDEEVVVPHAAHPSLPLPTARGKAKVEPGGEDEVDEEAINSDLDDSDRHENEEDPEEATVETDIVFVARVKNKWKCVLKDGMIHTGGKDYLFQRCTGEFEW
ncbi:transcription factor IIA, alpha/beta subunit [Mycena leptocephala]|nr:transcription factor IIA, alpha/beta subunit [Mycena leptocephala]